MSKNAAIFLFSNRTRAALGVEWGVTHGKTGQIPGSTAKDQNIEFQMLTKVLLGRA